ncbi:MAG: ATP-dependent DNA helicase RecG, partial [Acidobacteriales bacterium]|nr:ATP-dependent DNA helicase RecG [Terriglobales bacterium]
MLTLGTGIQYAKGVGPRIAERLAEKGIHTIEDLLFYLPFRYEDRANPKTIAELQAGEMAAVIGEVRGSALLRTRTIPIFELTLGAGRSAIKCLWFNRPDLQRRFHAGQTLAAYGKVEADRNTGKLKIIQPQIEILGDADHPLDPTEADAQIESSLEMGRIVPIYSAIGKLGSHWFRSLLWRTLQALEKPLPDPLPTPLRERLQLLGRTDAFERVHFPPPETSITQLLSCATPAHLRLIFEELFFLELGLELKRQRLRSRAGNSFELTDRVREAIKKFLPFRPTAAQKRVLGEIANDMKSPTPMRRLLQGDVGSGKTLVALEAAVIAI